MSTRAPPNRKAALVGWLAMITLQGCVSNSPTRLKAEADRLVHPGLKLSDAIGRLTHAGFTCDSPADDDTLTCTRMRSYAIVATCVQRINLVTDASGRSLTRIDVPSPACTGM